MAKSVDDLIEYLLEELALSGSKGVPINELASYVNTFYNGGHESGDESLLTSGERSNIPAVSVDKAFMSKVWKWLGLHPDVSIGHGKKYNRQPLLELEVEFPGCLDQICGAGSSENGSNKPTTKPREGPRLTVDEERIYRAICGHPRDASKIAPLEFVLLSHIAATRAGGIMQGELGRISGQDKRSVPKRTNVLHKKGYIVKETVYAKGNKTSRLTLRRFASCNGSDLDPSHVPVRQSLVRDVVRRIFDELAKQNLIPQAGLAEQMDMSSPANKAVLLKVLRRLDRMKLIKRVKTAFGPSASTGDLKQCIQLVKAPDLEELDLFATEDLSLDTPIAELASQLGIENSAQPTLEAAEDEDDGFDSAHWLGIAQWNPDRPMPNILRDAAQLAGAGGMTNWDARYLTTGAFTRRPVEALLYRISCRSLLVQPPHLRHLAIVRSHVVNDGISQFYHYSWDAFLELVQNTAFDLNQIPGAKQALKNQALAESSVHDQSTALISPEMDSAGFPFRKSSPLQINNGEIDFTDIIEQMNIGDILPRDGEPTIVEREPGVFIVEARGRVGARPRVSLNAHPAMPKKPRSTPVSKTMPRYAPIGRPRKYMRGTEKFWQRQFKQAHFEAEANSGGYTHSRSGIMQDPSGLALYANRPPDFDETLLQAIDAQLPVPAGPDDISPGWIRATKAVLERSADGIFITRRGLRPGSAKVVSQIMIIRSSRLNEVDLSDRRRAPAFRFISSSASHSFEYRRFYPTLHAPTGHASVGANEKERLDTKKARKPTKQKSGPPRGVFYEEERTPVVQSNFLPAGVDLTSGTSIGGVDTTDDEVERSVSDHRQKHPSRGSQRRSTSPAHDHGAPEEPILLSAGQIAQLSRAHSPSPTPVSAGLSRKRKITEKAMASAKRPKMLTNGVPQRLGFPARSEPDLRFTDLDPSGSPRVEAATEMKSVSNEMLKSAARPPTIDRAVDGTTTALSATIDEEGLRRGRSGASPFISPTNEPLEGSERDGSVIDDLDIIATVVPGPRLAAESPPQGRKSVKRRQRQTSSDPEVDDPKPKRKPRITTQRATPNSNDLCRRIVLHLVSDAGGAAPNDGFTMRRVATPRWKEAGFGDGPTLKMVKQSIKVLCQSGKLKQTMFSFRGRRGSMVKRSILYLPSILSDSSIVEGVKQKIIDADPTDYIPSCWSEEAARQPLVADSRREETAAPIPVSPERGLVSRNESGEGFVRSSSRMPQSTRSMSDSPPPPVFDLAKIGFLSLKVPAIHTLSWVQLENWRTELDRAARLASAPPPASTRPRRVRRGGLQANERSITWSQQHPQDFPASLYDILRAQCYEAMETEHEGNDLNWTRFAREIEIVEAWEQNKQQAVQRKRLKYAFINHTVPPALLHGAEISRENEFSRMVHFDDEGSESEIPFPPAASWPPFTIALTQDAEVAASIAAHVREAISPSPTPSENLTVGAPARPTKRKRKSQDADFSPQPKRRRGGRRGGGATERGTRAQHISESTGPKYFSRGMQFLRDLSEEQVHRTAVSIVVVRSLAGGLENFIDWPLVMILFPDDTENAIRGRWKTLSKQYRRDIAGLTENLQWKYLEALEVDQVPCVNFEDLRSTDWQGIVDWAVNNLDRFNLTRVDELPSEKSELLEASDITFAEPKRVQNLLAYGPNVSGRLREETFSSVVFGSTYLSVEGATQESYSVLEYQSRFEAQMSDPLFRLAKSWVFASVLTSEAGSDPELARAKLEKLAPTSAAMEDLLFRILRFMQDEKLVQRCASSQKVAYSLGYGIWEPAKKFYERFKERRMITSPMLRRAMTYKLDTLDAAFDRGEAVSIDKDAIIDDGDMVALLNLMASGTIKVLAGPDVPRTRYGLDWERVGYKTRDMDKGLLGFSVQIVQTPNYVLGDPKRDSRNIATPRGDADEEMGHIPPWLDIHGRFQRDLWEMYLGSVLGLLAQMPGTNAKEVSRGLGFGLDEGEVDLLLSWCVEAGFAQVEAKSKGYQTTPDWWMSVFTGSWLWS